MTLRCYRAYSAYAETGDVALAGSCTAANGESRCCISYIFTQISVSQWPIRLPAQQRFLVLKPTQYPEGNQHRLQKLIRVLRVRVPLRRALLEPSAASARLAVHLRD